MIIGDGTIKQNTSWIFTIHKLGISALQPTLSMDVQNRFLRLLIRESRVNGSNFDNFVFPKDLTKTRVYVSKMLLRKSIYSNAGCSSAIYDLKECMLLQLYFSNCFKISHVKDIRTQSFPRTEIIALLALSLTMSTYQV